MSEEDPKNTSSYGAAITIVAAVVLISMACWGAYVWNVGSVASDKSEDWGAFGSYFGGILGPVLSAASILFIWWQSHKTDLRAQDQLEVMDEQLKMIRVQQFESTFFKLYEHHKILLNEKKIVSVEEDPESIKDVFRNSFGSVRFYNCFDQVVTEVDEYIKSLSNISTLIVDNKNSLGDKDLFFSGFIRTFFDESEIKSLFFYLMENKELYSDEIKVIFDSKILRFEDLALYGVHFTSEDDGLLPDFVDLVSLIKICVSFLSFFNCYDNNDFKSFVIKFNERCSNEVAKKKSSIDFNEKNLKDLNEWKDQALNFAKDNYPEMLTEDKFGSFEEGVASCYRTCKISGENAFRDFDFSLKDYEDNKYIFYEYIAKCNIRIEQAIASISFSQRDLSEIAQAKLEVENLLA